MRLPLLVGRHRRARVLMMQPLKSGFFTVRPKVHFERLLALKKSLHEALSASDEFSQVCGELGQAWETTQGVGLASGRES